jgi:hypothetical protein
MPSASLKDLLHQPNLTQVDKLLLCLAVEVDQPKAVKEIKVIAAQSGLREAQKWNISSMLSRSRGRAVRTQVGWELTTSGKEHVSALAGPFVKPAVVKIATSLRSHLTQITDPQTAAFVEEAILCFENELYRAAVVLSWVGVVSVLYDYVLKAKLSAFNAEAKRRYPKWKAARTTDDLALMKESDFLNVLVAISVLGRNVKQQLENCLRLRNACGHPSSLKIAENTVAAHIEVLILNVFSRFKI